MAILGGTLRVATPLILCAMGGLFSERSGVVDVGLEGKMLAAAFAAGAAAAVTGSPWAGLAAGIGASLVLALAHGYAAITHGGNQVVSGMAINILASGLAIVFGEAWFRRGGTTPALPPEARFLPLAWPTPPTGFAPVDLVLSRVVGGHNGLVYGALLSVAVSGLILARTRFGLRLRAAGEEPGAVAAAGVSVPWLRYRAVLICGLFTGIAGTYLSIAQGAGFSRDMTAGAGFIALAALVFGKWRAVPACLACLMFGGIGAVPVQLFQALPYALTVVLLAGFVGRAVAPKAAGIPFARDRA